MARNVEGSKRGFGYDKIAKVLSIFANGNRITGFSDFETLYADPTATATAAIGQKAEDPLGGVWRYCKAGADLCAANTLNGAGCYSQPTDVTAGATAIGSYTLACSGSSDASCSANQYQNGTIVIGGSDAGYRRFYHIKGNTASATTTTTLTLYHPITYTLAGTEWATIVPSPWADVRDMSAAAGYMSVVCWPLRAVSSGYYFWAKTRGPVFGIVYSTVPGAAANDRIITTAPADGSIRLGDEAWDDAGESTQHLGWLIPRTGGDYAAGDQTFMLQLE